jgi:hypothetical protein
MNKFTKLTDRFKEIVLAAKLNTSTTDSKLKTPAPIEPEK